MTFATRGGYTYYLRREHMQKGGVPVHSHLAGYMLVLNRGQILFRVHLPLDVGDTCASQRRCRLYLCHCRGHCEPTLALPRLLHPLAAVLRTGINWDLDPGRWQYAVAISGKLMSVLMIYTETVLDSLSCVRALRPRHHCDLLAYEAHPHTTPSDETYRSDS